MAKKLLQDVIKKPNTFKRPDNIVLERDKKLTEAEDGFCEVELELSKNTNNPNIAIWSLALICIAFLFFGVFALFNRAIIVLNPRTENINFNQKLIFYKKTKGVSFDVGMMSGEETKNISTQETKYVERKAEGVVTIFNDTTKAQNFSINTRLLGSNEKIYKTKKEVIVPPAKKTETDLLPGYIEVEIEAESPGEEYNSIPMDFEIFAFVGTNKASFFKVLSKNEISGGFKGDVISLDEDVKNKLLDEMKENLKNRLFSQIKNQIPETSIIFDDSLVFKVESEDFAMSEGKDFFTLVLKGTVYVVLFDREELSKEIAKRSIEEVDENAVYLNNLDSFSFSYSSSFDTSNIFETTLVNFDLSGKAEIVWKVDEKKVLDFFVGRPKKDFNRLMGTFSNVSSAELSLRPPWNRYLPKNPDDFQIIVNYPIK